MKRDLAQAGALGRRAIWVVADQALSSLANAGLTIGLARIVAPDQYGAFALAFSAYSLVGAISQAVSSQIVVIRYAGAPHEDRLRAAGRAAGASMVVGLTATVVLAAVALVTAMPVSEALGAAAVVLPMLLLQDMWRTTFITFGEPRRAFTNDLLWVVLWASCFAVLVALDVRAAGSFLLVWGLSAGLAAYVAGRRLGCRPHPTEAADWVRDHRDTMAPVLANTLAILGALQLAFVLIAAVGSVDDVGSLRAAQTLLGPLNIAGFAASAFAVPEIVRHKMSTAGLNAAALALSGVMVLITAVWGGLLLLIPRSAGEELLGATWDSARQALPGLVVYSCATASTIGATAVMRALNRASSAFIVSALLGPMVLICSLVGESVDGSAGAADGFAVAGLSVIVPCWLLLLRDTRRGRREPTSVAAATRAEEVAR